MKPQGSNLNKPGSQYSLAPVLYNEVLFEMGATDLSIIFSDVFGSAFNLVTCFGTFSFLVMYWDS